MLRKGEPFLLLLCHLSSCYLSYNSSDKSYSVISHECGKRDTGLWLWHMTYNRFVFSYIVMVRFVLWSIQYIPRNNRPVPNQLSNTIDCICMINSHTNTVIIHLEITFIVAPHQTVITWVLNCEQYAHYDLSMKELCREFEYSHVSLQLWGCDQQTIIGAVLVWIVWYLDLQKTMQSVPITTNLWFPILLRRDPLDTTLCDKVCQWLARDRRFSPGTPVSSGNKNDRQDITEIFLKVALNTITLALNKH